MLAINLQAELRSCFGIQLSSCQLIKCNNVMHFEHCCVLPSKARLLVGLTEETASAATARLCLWRVCAQELGEHFVYAFKPIIEEPQHSLQVTVMLACCTGRCPGEGAGR